MMKTYTWYKEELGHLYLVEVEKTREVLREGMTIELG